MQEHFDVVDKNDKVIGRALRSECHKNPELIHRGILVIVTNSKGMILLQKRSMKKDLYPGLWGLSVGGHMALQEKKRDIIFLCAINEQVMIIYRFITWFTLTGLANLTSMRQNAR